MKQMKARSGQGSFSKRGKGGWNTLGHCLSCPSFLVELINAKEENSTLSLERKKYFYIGTLHILKKKDLKRINFKLNEDGEENKKRKNTQEGRVMMMMMSVI